MADFAPLKSAQYDNYAKSPTAFVASSDWGSKLRSSFGKLTFTAAGFSATEAQIIRMPAGKVRILSDLCRIICPQGTTTADLHVGYSAHTKNGAAVAGVNNAFADNLDVGGAAIDAVFSAPANGITELESDNGFDITAFIDTANSPATGDLIISVVYQMGN